MWQVGCRPPTRQTHHHHHHHCIGGATLIGAGICRYEAPWLVPRQGQSIKARGEPTLVRKNGSYELTARVRSTGLHILNYNLTV